MPWSLRLLTVKPWLCLEYSQVKCSKPDTVFQDLKANHEEADTKIVLHCKTIHVDNIALQLLVTQMRCFSWLHIHHQFLPSISGWKVVQPSTQISFPSTKSLEKVNNCSTALQIHPSCFCLPMLWLAVVPHHPLQGRAKQLHGIQSRSSMI